MEAFGDLLDLQHLVGFLVVLTLVLGAILGTKKLKRDRERARLWRLEQEFGRDGAKIRFRVAQRVREMKNHR